MNVSAADRSLFAAISALLVVAVATTSYVAVIHGSMMGGGMMPGGMMQGGMMGAPAGPPDAAPVNTSAVDMRESEFLPAVISVRPGETVTWVNRDPYAHTVTSDDPGGPLSSPSLAAGASWDFTFRESGTFLYHCIPHANKDSSGAYVGMTAKVVVL